MLALDHLVIAADDADEARLKFSAISGFKAYQGGRHENWGTYNYLSHFSNHCYIEWLSVFNESKAVNAANPLIKHAAAQLAENQQGPIQAAIRTTDMDQLLQHYQKNNLPFQGPFEGNRKKPDGTVLAWRMLFPSDSAGSLLPFLIEWKGNPPAPDDPDLINNESIRHIEWGVEDPAAARQLWMDMYQLDLPAQDNPYSFKLGNADISLVYGKNIHYHIE